MDFRIFNSDEGQKKFEIYSEKVYVKPKGANCIQVYAGKLSFGKTRFEGKEWELIDTNIGAIFKRETKRGKFFKLPLGFADAKIEVRFPEYYRNDRGHHYGIPKLHNVPLVNCPLLNY
ncbi:MAG: hypothetical protein HY773_00055 [Candidatus Terrybacteria bacterium]|nr:hypothetical protein [Candidatus Terrybacteria bacterium]